MPFANPLAITPDEFLSICLGSFEYRDPKGSKHLVFMIAPPPVGIFDGPPPLHELQNNANCAADDLFGTGHGFKVRCELGDA
jgi:hypothetical protein